MPFFKDFNKDVKDLLTKNYAENGAWKLESKAKAPEQTVFFNPSATHKGVTVDVEYNYKPFKTKTTVTEKGNVTPKVTWEDKHNKVEASVDKELKFEVVYEGKFGDITVHDKVTNHAADAYVSYALASLGLGVGGGAAFSIEKQSLKGWSAGVHYAKNGIVADVVTDSLKTYTTGVLFPLTIPGPIPKITVAAQTVCGSATKALGWTVGVEGGCPLCEGAKFRVKVDQDLKLSLAWFKKFGDNWKVAIGAEPLDKKFGLTFTRE